MAYQGLQVTFQGHYVTPIDATATGPINIFTPSARFTPQNIIFELISTTGFIAVASCSVGTNGASYNNILPISVLTGLSTVNNILQFSLNALISSVAAGTGIFLNVTTGATATTYVIKATINGVYT